MMMRVVAACARARRRVCGLKCATALRINTSYSEFTSMVKHTSRAQARRRNDALTGDRNIQ